MTEEIEDAPAPEEMPTAEEAGGKRLTLEQWAEIEAHCAYNTMSNKDMVAKYGVSKNAIYKHFLKLMENGKPIERGSKAHLLAAKTAAAIGVRITAAAAAPIVSAFNEKRKDNIEFTKTSLFNQDKSNHAQLMKLQKAFADGTKTPAEAYGDLKSLNLVTRIIHGMRENRWALLDIENDIDETSLPKLIFEDLSDDQIKELQSSDDGGEDDDFDFSDPAEDEDEVVEEGGE
jgi:hypothetical protein